MLRFPDGMRERLKQEAETNGRSLNAEIVNRLIISLDEQDRRKNLVAYINDADDRTMELLGAVMRSVTEAVAEFKATEGLPEAKGEKSIL